VAASRLNVDVPETRCLDAGPNRRSYSVRASGPRSCPLGRTRSGLRCPRPDTPVDVPDLVSHCRGLIAGYKVPKEIHLMDALPHTASGKVQKGLLRQHLRGTQQRT
jgi:acyl-CoA synthetase (AMP-forming)/AMP-acid ligase II